VYSPVYREAVRAPIRRAGPSRLSREQDTTREHPIHISDVNTLTFRDVGAAPTCRCISLHCAPIVRQNVGNADKAPPGPCGAYGRVGDQKHAHKNNFKAADRRERKRKPFASSKRIQRITLSLNFITISRSGFARRYMLLQRPADPPARLYIFRPPIDNSGEFGNRPSLHSLPECFVK